MQRRGDLLLLAFDCRNDLLTNACSMLNRCVENIVGFDYASRNNDATAHLRGKLFGLHAECSLRISVTNVEKVANYHHLQNLYSKSCLLSLRMSVPFQYW